MSSYRRSFPGIAEAWIARGDGVQKPFTFNAKTISTMCEINFLGDVNPTITFGIGCEIDGENLDVFHNMLTSCSISSLGDVNPIINMTMFCVVVVSNP